MSVLKRFPITSLLVANIAAFGLVLGAHEVAASAASSGGDFCDETKPTGGCICLEPRPFDPGGCHYDPEGSQFFCEDEEACLA